MFSPNPDSREQEYQDIVNFMPVGGEFMYMGTRMVVSDHQKGNLHPILLCRYKDDNGHLRLIDFNHQEVMALKEGLEEEEA